MKLTLRVQHSPSTDAISTWQDQKYQMTGREMQDLHNEYAARHGRAEPRWHAMHTGMCSTMHGAVTLGTLIPSTRSKWNFP